MINFCGKLETTGQLETEEDLVQKKLIIKREESQHKNTESFKNSSEHLNLHMNKEDIYQYNGRIQGGYLAFIPNK